MGFPVGVVEPWGDWCGEDGGSEGEEEGEDCEWECVFHGRGRWVRNVCLD